MGFFFFCWCPLPLLFPVFVFAHTLALYLRSLQPVPNLVVRKGIV
jgi:hypothetical protein